MSSQWRLARLEAGVWSQVKGQQPPQGADWAQTQTQGKYLDTDKISYHRAVSFKGWEIYAMELKVVDEKDRTIEHPKQRGEMILGQVLKV